MEQEVLDGLVAARRGEGFRFGLVEFLRGGVRRVHAVEHELMNGLLAEVIGDFRPCVVGSEFLLVDIFLEDVAEHVRIDLAVVTAGRVVEGPGVGTEEREEILEDDVRHLDLGVGLGEERVTLDAGLNAVGQEQAAIEVRDVAERHGADGFALVLGFGETLEEEIAQEVGEESVFPGLLRGGEFFRKIVGISRLGAAHVEKALSLEEPYEHQAVQQDGGIPAALAGIWDAFDGVQQLAMLFLEVLEEDLGDGFDVESVADPAGGLGDGDVAVLVEFG